MTSKEFRKIFEKTAKKYGFKSMSGGCYKDSPECLTTLYLQKSDYGDYFQLNINIYVQGYNNKHYIPDKNIVQLLLGQIKADAPHKYRNILDFDEEMEDDVRISRLEELFETYIIPLTDKGLSKQGIIELLKTKKFLVPPGFKEFLRSE